MQKLHHIYLTTNKINGKEYIGVHSGEDITSGDRFTDGYVGCGVTSVGNANGQYKRNKKLVFPRAVVKYGIKNFDTRILFSETSREFAYELEKFIVNKEWVKSKNTYNVATGGYGGNGKSVNSDNIEKVNSDIDVINKLYTDGLSAMEIAKIYKVSDTSIRTRLYKGSRSITDAHQAKDGTSRLWRVDRDSKLIDSMYNDGKTIDDLAMMYGVDSPTIRKHIKRKRTKQENILRYKLKTK